METEYSGGDILAALESAPRYNEFLTTLVRRSAAGNRRLIDFGAGVGTYAKRLRDEGFQVLCIEPDRRQRQQLSDDGFETLADIESVENGTAASVFSLNVLEHIENDSGAVSQIYRKLQPGGTLLIYVPAFRCLWSSLDDQVEHFRRYTKSSLRELVEHAGFVVDEVSYADSLGFAAALLFRGLHREASSITGRSVGLYDRWIFPASRFLDKLAHPVFGKNTYVLCHKPKAAHGRGIEEDPARVR